MTDTNLPLTADGDFDDLPRTLRRERDRQAAESASTMPSPAYEVHHDGYQDGVMDEPTAASVRRFDVPFLHLMFFLLKAVIAAIPALLLLTVILWFAGQALQAFFPELVQLKILISLPAETTP